MNKLPFGIAFLSLVWLAAATVPLASAGTVTITSPANGATVTDPVTVSAYVDSTTCNSGFNHLQVLVNGIILYNSCGHCSFSAAVAMPQGSDTVNVQAIAWNGALMAQSAISVTVPAVGAATQAVARLAPALPANDHEISGTIKSVAGDDIVLATRTGKLVRVDASNAVRRHLSVVLLVGEPVTVLGSYGKSGTVDATSISRAKPSPKGWPSDR